MRIALLHHWFMYRGGSERVMEALAALFPDADVYTLFAKASGVPPRLRNRVIRTSFLQNIPGATTAFPHMLPLYPAAALSLDLRKYDLVISSDMALAKGARIRKDAVHLCYCHSPMRMLYDDFKNHCKTLRPISRRYFKTVAPLMRQFDRRAADRVHTFIANSYYVNDRIGRVYGKRSHVVYPPVDTRLARLNPPGDHYLVAGRLDRYKRVDIVIEACEFLQRPLRIVGTGPDEDRLRKFAGVHTTFLGDLPDEQLWDEYSRCRALIFAADEDFGLIPVEVQACGRPVLAYGLGGALETVRAEDPPLRYAPRGPEQDEVARRAPTGRYFSPQTGPGLAVALSRFEQELDRFRPEHSIENAAQFNTRRFLDHMTRVVDHVVPAALPKMASVEEALLTLQA